MQDTTVTGSAADHIRRLRLERGWTAQQLADECKLAGFPALTRGTIAKIESKARKHVTADELAVLAHVLGVDVDELLGSAAAAKRFVRDQFTNIVVEAGLAEQLRANLHPAIPGLPAEVTAAPNPRATLTEIVDLCSRATGGLAALAQVVEFLRPGGLEAARLRELAEQLTPAGDIEALRRIVGEVVVPDLAELVREAGGGLLAQPGDGVVETYLDLFELAGGEEPLVPLRFLELVAGRSPAVQEELRYWINQRAGRLNIWREILQFRVTRFPPPVRRETVRRETLTLMICISESREEVDECLLASWRQREPGEWPPPRGPVRRVARADLELAVDEFVREAEIAWAGYLGEIQLEFVLPRSLLDLPVEEWRTELGSGAPVPLALQYPVSVRSLERMRTQRWHRAWRRRTEQLLNSASEENFYWMQAEDVDAEAWRNDAILSDDRWAAVALSSPAPGVPARADELTSTLRAGVPIVVWNRDGGFSGAAVKAMRDLMGDAPLSELPRRIAEARREAYQNPEKNSVRRLALLWDDPARVISGAELDLANAETE